MGLQSAKAMGPGSGYDDVPGSPLAKGPGLVKGMRSVKGTRLVKGMGLVKAMGLAKGMGLVKEMRKATERGSDSPKGWVRVTAMRSGTKTAMELAMVTDSDWASVRGSAVERHPRHR